MKKRKSHTTQEIEIPITDLPLESFREIIKSGQVEGEIPFDLLAEQYPELLEEWYPGYPGALRKATPTDPFPVRAYVKDKKMTLGINGLDDSYPTGEEVPDGSYYVWIKREENQTFTLHGIFSHLDESMESVVEVTSSKREQ